MSFSIIKQTRRCVEASRKRKTYREKKAANPGRKKHIFKWGSTPFGLIPNVNNSSHVEREFIHLSPNIRHSIQLWKSTLNIFYCMARCWFKFCSIRPGFKTDDDEHRLFGNLLKSCLEFHFQKTIPRCNKFETFQVSFQKYHTHFHWFLKGIF